MASKKGKENEERKWMEKERVLRRLSSVHKHRQTETETERQCLLMANVQMTSERFAAAAAAAAATTT